MGANGRVAVRRIASCIIVTTMLVGATATGAIAQEFEPGERIIYVSAELEPSGEIHLLTDAGTTRLTNNTFSEGYPRWSPDGNLILFYSNRDGNNEIYVMEADGSGQTNLTNDPGGDAIAAWSPDGTRIAFASGRTGDTEIFVMNADGSDPVNVSNNPGGNDWAPDWSPDGTRITYISNRDGNGEIYVMDASGAGQTNLTNSPAGDYGPRWSPDGMAIAFQSDRDGDFEIFVMGADGSNPTNLTNSDATDIGAAWSPDGSQLIYSADVAGGSDIWVMNADGSKKRTLISATGGQYAPDWAFGDPRFADVPFDNTFHEDIDWLANGGITKGCNPPENSLFCPDDAVTRGQMAAFLGRALGYTDDGGGDLFADDNDSIFELDIDRLVTAGVTRGCDPPLNDNYCPDGVVTRGQMAAFLHRALEGVLVLGPPVSFVDDDGSIFEADIEWLGATGVTRGCNPPTNDRFCSESPVTRAQMAAFLHRALG
jgi:TolB protein